MFKKEIKFSTKWKVHEIVEKLEVLTKGRHLNGHKRIEPNYIGEFDNSGFTFFRSEMNFLGNYIFSAEFIESESSINIIVSIYPSAGTYLFYFLIDVLILLSLFIYHINFNITKVIVIALLLLMPISIMYFSYREDVKRANKFLVNFFQIKKSTLFK